MRGKPAIQIQEIPIQWPLGGQSIEFARSEQPPRTSVDCLNVLPYDRPGRARGGVRPGLYRIPFIGGFDSAIHTFLIQTSYYSAGIKKVSLVTADTTGHIWRYDGVGNPVDIGLASLSTTPQLCAGTGGVLFAVDGTVFKKITLPATIANHSASAGVLPTGVTLCAIWRNRLVVAGPDQNWYMSRVGSYGDFDYGAPATDVARAVAGSNTGTIIPGGIDGPIVALMPWNDSELLVGGDRTIWRITGDLAAGGEIRSVSGSTGVVGPNAWTIDPDGAMWIVCTGGLYRYLGAGLEPKSTARQTPFFNNLDRTTNIRCAWDRDRHGLWINVQKASTVLTSLFYDDRNDGFWPMQFDSGTNAKAVLAFDGDAPADRRIYLARPGGGISYFLDTTASDSTSTPINAYIYFGPYRGNFSAESKTFDFQAALGETPSGFTDAANWKADWALQAGRSPYEAYASPDVTETGSFATSGRQSGSGTRVAGHDIFLKLSNGNTLDKLFSFDEASVSIMRGGRVR